MMFGWQRTRSDVLMPVIVYDRLHGCAKHEFVGGLHQITPDQQRMTLAELAAVYPAPELKPE